MKKQNYIVGLLFLLFAVSCEEKEDKAYLAVSPLTLEFAVNGEIKTLNIKCDADWSIMNAPGWVELSMPSGVNDAEVRVTAKTNSTGISREDILRVKTNVGHQEVIVNLMQYGDSRGANFLDVVEHQKKWMNGLADTEGFTDSVYVDSNTDWTVDGPDWLTAMYNNKMIPLTGKIAYHGSGMIYIRPKGDNVAQEEREGVLLIRSEKASKTVEIPVAQLGPGRVEPNTPLIMAHGISTYFKFGTAVGRIRYKLFEGTAPDSELSYESANSWGGGEFKESRFLALNNLKPNTQYELCVRTSWDGTYNNALNRYTFTTASDNNRPECKISNVTYSSGKWRWRVEMNTSANGYYVFVRTKEVYFGKSDITIAQHFLDAMKSTPNNYNLYKADDNFSFSTDGDLLVAIWPVDMEGELSSLITVNECKQNSSTRSFKVETNEIIYTF